MKKLTLLVLIFFCLHSYSQKAVSIPENQISRRFYENLDSLLIKFDLQDLRKSDQKVIRIWKNNEILQLGENSTYIFHSSTGNEPVVVKKEFQNKSDIDSQFKAIENNIDWKNKNGNYRIDAFPISIELNTGNSYQVISFYKNDQLQNIINNIRRENSTMDLREKIVQNLSPGIYSVGMTTLKVDHLPEGEKSDFYAKIYPEIKEKLGIDEESDPTKMPLVLINDKPYFFQNLNTLDLKEVLDYKITRASQILYGNLGMYGVIKVETKQKADN